MSCVLWFTGLPASGKSTLCEEVAKELGKRNLEFEHLDGDQIRSVFPTGFTKEERDLHIRRVGFIASLLESHKVIVLASFVSPYREARNQVRAICKNFIEIHISTPLSECEKRDPKKLYQKARQGEIQNFTGVSAPYEPPTQAELTFDTSKVSANDAVQSILAELQKRKIIR